MANDDIRSDGVFDPVDIRDVPDDQLDDLMGGSAGAPLPFTK
jgi:hypothetical protein